MQKIVSLGKVNFNMTGGIKILRGEGVFENFYTSERGLWKNKGGAPKSYILNTKPTEGGRAPKKWTAAWGGGGAAKISSFEFQYLHPYLVILNLLSLSKVCLESWLSFQMIHSKGKELRFCGFSAVIRALLCSFCLLILHSHQVNTFN